MIGWMKRRKTLGLVVALAWAALGPTSALAANDAEIQAAIDSGLGYLAGTQQGDGSWNYGGYNQAATGAATFSMLSQSNHWADTGNVANYTSRVGQAVNYLLGNATVTTVSTRNDGVNICPGGGTCTGVYWGAGSSEETYTTGLVAPALVEYATQFGGGANAVATTSGPLAGKKWGEIAQYINNEWASGQNTTNNGVYNGGWRYFPGQGGNGAGSSDMSTTQWALINFLYTQTLGATVPAAINTNLAAWLLTAQDISGAGCYGPASPGICDNSDTGGLLLGLKFLGKNTSDPAVQKALQWLNANWKTGPNGTWFGDFGHPYAMWSDYKALQLTIGLNDTTTITNLLDPTCSGQGFSAPTSGICNWWQDYNQWLVANQSGGSFPGYSYWDNPLATALELPILGGVLIPPPPPVPEPGTLLLLGSGLVGLVGLGWRRKRQ